MHTVKEKVSNAAASAKEHVDIMKAKAEEKTTKAYARTKEEKVIAEEVRKAKEHEAKMKLHETKAENAAEKLRARQSHGILGHHHTPEVGVQGHHHHHTAGTAVPPTTGVPAQNYPVGGGYPAAPTGYPYK